jgi:hypothetical protein
MPLDKQIPQPQAMHILPQSDGPKTQERKHKHTDVQKREKNRKWKTELFQRLQVLPQQRRTTLLSKQVQKKVLLILPQ